MTTTDTTCIVYCRVSSDRQAKEDKGSLDAQERHGLAKAAEMGLRVLYVVKDAESAAILDKRSKFQAVLNDAKAGKFGVMIVDRMNRFTRSEDLDEYLVVMAQLREAGVRPVFVDKAYEDSRTGQLQRFIDAYVSAGEQDARRKQSLQGKRNKVHNLHRPNPGSWAPYGYVWADAAKTRLAFDPGESQAITRRIWNYFLHGSHPTLAGCAKALNRDHVQTPREYRGVAKGRNALATGPRWTAVTIRDILHDERYWGGDENGMVRTFRYAQHNDETRVPAYGPGYMSRAEAERVHARLTTNKYLASRNRKVDRGTLLHGGLVKCTYCGWSLAAYTAKKPRPGGGEYAYTIYRCLNRNAHGTATCKGTTIVAETLDLAVLTTLDEQIHRGDFLQRIFAAWERDAESAMTAVRSAEATLHDAQTQVANATARLATYAPDDPLAAPLENHARMVADTIPGLQVRVAKARAAVATARGNPELRQQLATWFDTWIGGVWLLNRDAQREFLASLGAQVKLWRAEDRAPLPRAQLVLALPSSALSLPSAPDAITRDPDTGNWLLNVDTAAAAQLVADARDVSFVDDQPPTATAAGDGDGDAAAILQAVVAELMERGYSESAARSMAGYRGNMPATAYRASTLPKAEAAATR